MVRFNSNLPRYLYFINERHGVHERRSLGLPGPWTDNPVIASKKFCNMFRVLDYGSQFVAKELLGPTQSLSLEEALFRAFLYRYTNRPEPWKHFHLVMGRYPLIEDLYGPIQRVWGQYKLDGNPIFGSAYTMFVGKENAGMTRLEWILDLCFQVFTPTGKLYPVVQEFRRVRDMDQHVRLNVLKQIPRTGDFMGMQVLVDLGYWKGEKDRENEFAAIGPGSKRGLARLTDSKDYLPAMRELQHLVHIQHRTPKLRLGTRYDGFGGQEAAYRLLSLTDIQNTLCEYDKYERYSNGEVRDRTYRPAHPDTYTADTNYTPTHWK